MTLNKHLVQFISGTTVSNPTQDYTNVNIGQKRMSCVNTCSFVIVVMLKLDLDFFNPV